MVRGALAVAVSGDVGAGLVDTNGDGVEIALGACRRRRTGGWEETDGSEDVGEDGSVALWTVDVSWGWGEPGSHVEVEHRGARHAAQVSDAGWWLVITPRPDLDDGWR